MSDPKTTLLVLGAGCAAMIGIAAAVLSAGSFFSDVPALSAETNALQLPARKVKTVAILEKPAEKGAAVTPDADRETTSSLRPGIPAETLPHLASPRWARNAVATAESSPQQKAILAAYADDDISSRIDGADAPAPRDDPFAMIVTPDDSDEPTVELAGTVPHVPDPAPRAEEPADEVQTAPAPKLATTGRALSDTATINEAANMRAAPRSGSGILTVVPDGARVSIAPGCEQWCEISYNGRRGFVYKDFIGGGRVAARASAKAQNASTDPMDKTIEKTVYGDSNFLNSGKPAAEAADADEKPAAKADAAVPKKQPFVPSSR